MKSKYQQNIYITCVDTETATTADGLPVTYYSVNALLQQFAIEIKNRDGSKRQYNHEYAALTAVVPTAGSRFISFETLISAGLFDLYPQLQYVNNRHSMRLHIAVTDLQAFGFSTEQALSKNKIDTAARLVFSFQACSPSKATETNDGVEMHLFARSLSLMKRHENHATLNSWLESHSALILEYFADAIAAPITGMEDPEFLQYKQTLQHVEGRSLLRNKVDSDTRISRDTIARDLAIWQAWRREKRDRHRAARPDRDERVRAGRLGRGYRRRIERPERTERVGVERRRKRYDRSRSPKRDRPRADRYVRRMEHG